MANARQGSGCSALLAFAFVVCAFLAIYNWPVYVDSTGSQTTATITEKHETVSVNYDNWYRRFGIIASYRIPGQPLLHRAGCDVDEAAYDSLHVGNTVTVHYLPNLLNQPFVSATHLAPCTSAASIHLDSAFIRTLAWLAMVPLVVVFLWKVFRFRLAAFLLIPWAIVLVAYLAIPRQEPAPQHPVAGTAAIQAVTNVSEVLESDDSKGIPLQHPYQIVRLQFTPNGMDTPVVAVDKIDLGSLPALQPGQNVDIFYDSAHPRVARLQAGTRAFPVHATATLILTGLAFLALLLVAWFLRLIFVRNPVIRALRASAALRRQQRRRLR